MWWEYVVTYFAGVCTTLVGFYKWLSGRISKQEMEEIVEAAKEAYEEYKKAKQNGNIDTDEMLKIAEKSVEVVELLLKALSD